MAEAGAAADLQEFGQDVGRVGPLVGPKNSRTGVCVSSVKYSVSSRFPLRQGK